VLSQATRRIKYENVKIHRLKYKSEAKERRKQKKRENMGGIVTPK
jgi:hypothetical protein